MTQTKRILWPVGAGLLGTTLLTLPNLSDAETSLDFEVAMNTHSVDLGMDLATLATLSADNGRSVSATLWHAIPV